MTDYIPAAVFILCFICYLLGTAVGRLDQRQRDAKARRARGRN